MKYARAEEDIHEDLAWWWDCQQEWLNADFGNERDEGLALCRERLAHFAEELVLARRSKVVLP